MGVANKNPDDLPPRVVTRALDGVRDGQPGAETELFQLVYDELRRIAGAQMGGEIHTLQPTALVHEAYLKLFGPKEPRWEDRNHFFNSAARAMRSVLVDMARARATKKRGGDRVRITFNDDLQGRTSSPEEMLAIHDALQKLESIAPVGARIVELRFFAGLTLDAICRIMDTPKRTVSREWEAARLWLYREIAG